MKNRGASAANTLIKAWLKNLF